MENKKYLPLRIVHYALMLVAFGFALFSFIKTSSTYPFLANLSVISLMAALIIGLIYAVLGYKKQDAKYYKTSMWAYLISASLHFVCIISSLTMLPGYAFLYVIALILITMLATCNDLGKQKSYIVAVGLVLCKIITFLVDLFAGFNPETIELGVISNSLTYIMLAGNAMLMVAGKYVDKDARGAK